MQQPQTFAEALLVNSLAPDKLFSFYKVAAYITAFQDADALNACISAIKVQSYPVKQIFVVDNSPQPLPLLPTHKDTAILVHARPENVGVSGGLRLGIEWAVEQGYDFLWTFDQDSVPAPECLELLLKAYAQLATEDYKVSIIAPTTIDARTGQIIKSSVFLGDRFRGYDPPSTSDPYECDAPITSGSLVWMNAAKQVTAPDSGLFIDGVDLDYGFRLRQADFRNLVVPTALMYHCFGTPYSIQLFKKKKVLQLYSPLRYYYICRNHTYLELRYSQGKYRLTCCLRRIGFVLLTSLKILIFDSGSKTKKIRAGVVGTWDGFLGKLGKNWQ